MKRLKIKSFNFWTNNFDTSTFGISKQHKLNVVNKQILSTYSLTNRVKRRLKIKLAKKKKTGKNRGETRFESVSKCSARLIVHFSFRKITNWGILLLLTQKCTGQLLQFLELLHQNPTWQLKSVHKKEGGGIDGTIDGSLMPALVPTLLCGMGLMWTHSQRSLSLP